MVPEHKINSFVGKIKLGISFFEDAGRELVEMLDQDPRIFDEIIAISNEPWVTVEVLQTFESIGRKQLAVEAMFLPKHVLNRLIALPVGQQLEIATKPIQIVTGNRNGHARVTDMRARDLSGPQARLAIGPAGIRPVAEQKKLLLLKSHKEESIGRFTVFIMNNKPFIKHSKAKGLCTKVLVTDEKAIEIDLVRVVPIQVA